MAKRNKTSLFTTHQKGGVVSVVDNSVTTGTIFWVDSGNTTNGGDTTGHGGAPDYPFLTVNYAITQAAANNGDIIYVMPGHTETVPVTTGWALSTAGVTIIGIGYGRARPVITAHASAIDAITVSGANCRIENIVFKGAASCTAFIEIEAADLEVHNCIFEHISVPEDGITVAAGGDRFKFTDCTFAATADGPNTAFDLQGAGIEGPWEISRCIFNYAPNGLDDGAIVANDKAVTGGMIRDCVFIAMETIAIDFNSSTTAAADGIITGSRITAISQSDIDGLIDPGGYVLIDNYGSDLVTEGGGLIPVTTPA